MQTVCIIGGTGFVGKHLVYRVVENGDRVRILTRRPEHHKELTVIPQVTLVQADVHAPDELRRGMEGCAAVINLAGILNERRGKNQGFHSVHVELPEKIVAAAAATGIRRLIQMSALNADNPEKRSNYLKTKAEGERLMHAASSKGVAVTSFQPSVIFGPGDSFFNRFQKLLALCPRWFPLACAETVFAPVYVGDVARAFATALADKSTIGERYQLCGPQQFTLRELVQYTARLSGIKCNVIGLNDGLSRLQARFLELVPGKPFSMDNYHSLQLDSICTDAGLDRLAIKPTPIESVVPSYLGRQRIRDRYAAWRRHARRQ